MSMPKTPLDKDNSIEFRQNDVRFSGKVFSMKPEPEASLEKGFPQKQFRFRVPAFYRSHISAACGFIVNVGHSQAALDFSLSEFALASRMRDFISSATARKTGTATELPNCL